MLKRVMAIASLLVAVPVFAHAWTVNTWVKNGGGNIVVDSNPAQTSVNGSVFKTYADSTASVDVTVSANTGYTIKALTIDGSVVTSAAGTTSYPTSVTNGANHSVYVTFRANPCAVTSSVTGSGSVTPASITGVLYGQIVKQPIKFAVTPRSGYKVSSVTVPSGLTYVPASIDGRSAHVYIPKDYVFTGPVAISATFVANGVATPTANAGNAQVLVPPVYGGLGLLDGSASAGMTSAVWTALSARDSNGTPLPLPVLTSTGLGTATFPVSDPDTGARLLPDGTYVFQLAINGVDTTPGTDALGHSVPVISPLVARTTVVINSSASAVVKSACVNCHNGNNVGVATNVFGNWSSSDHAANQVVCATCHVGANTGSHPGSTFGTASLKNVCLNCHNSSDEPEGQNYLKSSHYANPYGEGVVYCSSCHNEHLPTMGIYSTNHRIGFYTANNSIDVCTKCHSRSAGRPYGIYSSNGVGMAPHFDPSNSGAVAYTNNRLCTDCHGHNNAINSDYKQSAHADVTSPAWGEGGSSSPCVRCHTTTGFIAYSSFKVVAPLTTPIVKEVLACSGCHTSPDMTYSAFANLTTVNGVTGSLRTIAAYPATYTQTGSANVSFQFPDVGPSNLCIPCHSGRVSGKNIQGLTSNMANTGFKNSHYKAVAGIMYRSIGYEYAGQDYSDPANTGSVYYEHTLIGSSVTNADAVSAPNTGTAGPCAGCHMTNGPGHTLQVFTTADDGTVTGLTNSICVGCHTSGGRAGALDFATDLTQLNAQITGFQASLGALQALLQTQGIYYNSESYPYFFKDATYNTTTGTTTDWTLGTNNNSIGKNNMGAAFNLNLLTREPGAYAHNRYYTKRLIFDAIDWLQHGSMTGAIDISTIPSGAPDGHGGTTLVFDLNAAANYLGAIRP